MFVVLFEVQPRAQEWDRYLALAGTLRPELTQIRGFIDNERYRSERTNGRVLSISTWQDEKALIRWRTHARHHKVQQEGRFEVFQDYRLRVGEVITDSHQDDLPQTRFDVTEAGAARAVTVSETPPGQAPPLPPPSADLVDAEHYSPINTNGRQLLLASWRANEAARAWIEQQPNGPRHRHIRIIRDYGVHQRDEAPQYYPHIEHDATRPAA
jgi:heme-degrading monooxygenase HmoA